nr:retinal rod rhodopsin-sensitive cGMP 3',5'-cyclic phosphodiesterase subunit delta-like [Halyomorpha halys]
MTASGTEPIEDLREVLNRRRGNKILSGFQINHVTLSDQKSGKIFWRTNEDLSNPQREHEIYLPKTIFQSSLLRCEANFSSVYGMRNFRIELLMFFKGHPIEESKSEYGCVIPFSVNNWKMTITPTSDAPHLPLDLLSGHITIEVNYYDENTLIATTKTLSLAQKRKIVRD